MESTPRSGNGGCPPDETLAALLDGRGRRRERRELMAHFDGCARCRSVLAYSGEYRARGGAAGAAPRPSWRDLFSPASVRYAAVTVLALAGMGVGLAVRSALHDGPRPGESSTGRFVEPLVSDSSPPPRRDEHWAPQGDSFLFASGSTPSQRAFRIGVAVIDFRVELGKARRGDAEAVLQSLRSLSRTPDGELFAARWSSLEQVLSRRAEEGRLRNDLERLDEELVAALDPMSLDFGRWTEAGRLAAGRGDLRFFRDPIFRKVLSELLEEELDEPTRREVAAIRALTSPVSEDDLAELELRFRQLILLH